MGGLAVGSLAAGNAEVKLPVGRVVEPLPGRVELHEGVFDEEGSAIARRRELPTAAAEL